MNQYQGQELSSTCSNSRWKDRRAILHILSRMLSEDWRGLTVLYVCPIRALLRAEDCLRSNGFGGAGLLRLATDFLNAVEIRMAVVTDVADEGHRVTSAGNSHLASLVKCHCGNFCPVWVEVPIGFKWGQRIDNDA